MMKILITGFGPFLDCKTNPSQRVCEALASTSLPNIQLKTVILPVAYHDAAEKLSAEINELGPDIVLCLGLAAERTRLEIEKVALNFRSAAAPDNNSVQAIDEVIDSQAPDCYFTTLPYREMLAACERLNIKAALSLSAGAYVCNEVFFTLMKGARDHHYRGGFIHLPPQGEDDFLRVLPAFIEVFGHEF